MHSCREDGCRFALTEVTSVLCVDSVDLEPVLFKSYLRFFGETKIEGQKASVKLRADSGHLTSSQNHSLL